MIGTIKWGWDLAYQFREGIVTTVAPLLIGTLAEKNRGRDSLTLIHLNLADETFNTWIKTTYGAENVEEAKNHPAWVHLKSQLYSDLSRKMILPVIAIASLYITSQNASLISSLKNLVSHSADISRVALPVLDRMAANPSLSKLLDLRVAVCAPVAAKLLLLSVNYLKGSYSHEDYLTRSLEMVSGLTFSLYFLGVSTTIYHSVANSLYVLAIEHFFLPDSDLSGLTQFIPNQTLRNMLRPFSEIKLMTALQWLPSALSHLEWFKNPGYFWVSHVFNLICYFDYLPTNAFLWGLQATLASYQATSAPYDVAILQELFKKINNLVCDEFEKNVTDLMKEIHDNQKSEKISATLANGLKTLLHEKNKMILKSQAEKILELPLPEIPKKAQETFTVFDSWLNVHFISKDQHTELKAIVKEQLQNYKNDLLRIFRSEACALLKIDPIFRNPQIEKIRIYQDIIQVLESEDIDQLTRHFKNLPEDPFEKRETLISKIHQLLSNEKITSEELTQVQFLFKFFYQTLIKLAQAELFSNRSPPMLASEKGRQKVDEKAEELLQTFLERDDNHKHIEKLFSIIDHRLQE